MDLGFVKDVLDLKGAVIGSDLGFEWTVFERSASQVAKALGFMISDFRPRTPVRDFVSLSLNLIVRASFVEHRMNQQNEGFPLSLGPPNSFHISQKIPI